jgi:hypothetical protein
MLVLLLCLLPLSSPHPYSFLTSVLSLDIDAYFLLVRIRSLTGHEYLYWFLNIFAYFDCSPYHVKIIFDQNFHIAFKHPELLCTHGNTIGSSGIFLDKSICKLSAQFLTSAMLPSPPLMYHVPSCRIKQAYTL